MWEIMGGVGKHGWECPDPMGNSSEHARISGILGNFAAKLALFEKNMGIIGKKCTQIFVLYIVFALIASARFVEKA
ncbi:hypothetical protein [Aliiroseovarius crassostreae]|uniref:hypothetical protein n=1 Tax=Aliiroseovarius crassostreae TaxID=154981 RepID=UPI0021FEE9ED|nr:hypothetical protein [Aliiroseovarius crassostreae]UWP97454.1 hypothetical protein K3X53_08525 [Aliiroseovarius crassostreae]